MPKAKANPDQLVFNGLEDPREPWSEALRKHYVIIECERSARHYEELRMRDAALAELGMAFRPGQSTEYCIYIADEARFKEKVIDWWAARRHRDEPA